MPKLVIKDRSGNVSKIDFDSNFTLMEALRDKGYDIEASCGGCCACATCHVYFSDADFARVGSPSDDEMDMLELAFGLTPTSRLGCQITIDENLDGLVVKVPEDY